MEAIQDLSTTHDVALAASCAPTPVLITAAYASEVEHIARCIHATGDRSTSPFVLVAAAELPTDAEALTRTCADLLATAGDGSLLLAAVEQMPNAAQDWWLERFAALQGAREPVRGVRLMAGTTTILHHRLADGTFSERLFYRLNVIHVVA